MSEDFASFAARRKRELRADEESANLAQAVETSKWRTAWASSINYGESLQEATNALPQASLRGYTFQTVRLSCVRRFRSKPGATSVLVETVRQGYGWPLRFEDENDEWGLLTANGLVVLPVRQAVSLLEKGTVSDQVKLYNRFIRTGVELYQSYAPKDGKNSSRPGAVGYRTWVPIDVQTVAPSREEFPTFGLDIVLKRSLIEVDPWLIEERLLKAPRGQSRGDRGDGGGGRFVLANPPSINRRWIEWLKNGLHVVDEPHDWGYGGDKIERPFRDFVWSSVLHLM